MKYSFQTLFLFLMIATVSLAATWSVELDGSGDYTNIQPAVEAAASGDTVLIGPGRWDEMFSYTVPGWTQLVIVAVNNKDLTLIGSGQGVTIVGPVTPPPFSNPGPIGITMGTDHELKVQNLTIENMRTGLYFWGLQVEVMNVQFLGCYIGSSPWATGGGVFIDCRFDDCTHIGIFATSRANGMLVQNCRFQSAHSKHISLQNVENIVIEGSDFIGGNVSVQFDGVSCYGTVRNCIMTEGEYNYFRAVSSSRMELIDNEAYGGRIQISCEGYATVSGCGNLFNGTVYLVGDERTINCNTGYLDLHNNHIMRGDAPFSVGFAWFTQSFLMEQHLENNYWGTDDPDSLAAWIFNEDDDPSLNIQTFIAPFDIQPIENRKMSLGEVKQIYR